MVELEKEKIYRSYYTKSSPIVSYMVQKLSIESGVRVFEPCAGDGVFIDALNSKIPNLSIDIFELNPEAVSLLKEKYKSHSNITEREEDTLTNEELFLFSKAGGVYDRIIANPPYGGWQDHDRRKILKKFYPGLYVKETYTLFLYRCIQLLRDKGILVFIIPDTFLNLHMHTTLREYLLTNTKVKEITLFPSSFFPGVNFGYSNLSIITLERCFNKNECLRNDFKVITGFKNVEELTNIEKGLRKNLQLFIFSQKNTYENLDHALFITENPRVTHLINNVGKRIGDIAACVTGFYSGSDKNYLRPISPKIRNAKKYKVVNKDLISKDYIWWKNILNGIKSPKCFIPIVKGGGVKYFKPDNWHMDWSIKAVKNYKRDKKARFQNSEYYFKYGIGVPMVSSNQISASIIENKLFDQSIVGIFSYDKKWTSYLLALFNSPTCNELIRTINPTANNPANYIKKIPFVLPRNKELKIIDTLVAGIIHSIKQEGTYDKQKEGVLNDLIKKIYKL